MLNDFLKIHKILNTDSSPKLNEQTGKSPSTVIFDKNIFAADVAALQNLTITSAVVVFEI